MPWIEDRPGGYIVRWRDSDGSHCTEVIDRKPLALVRKAEIATELAARRQAKTATDIPLAEILKRYQLRQIARGSRDIHVDKQVGRMARLCLDQHWALCRQVTPASVEEWRQGGGSPRAGAYLRAVLRWAKETLNQRVDDRALVALRPRPLSRRPKPALVTIAQIGQCQDQADKLGPEVGTLVHCLATYGWRPITAADLKVQDLDLATGTITTLVKGGDTVRHPLLPETLARLRPLVKGRGGHEALFLMPFTGEVWSPNASEATSISRWLFKALGLRAYDLKRWAISSMLAHKLEPQTVALFTGHRTISQVLTYARTNEERARAALASLSPPPVGTSGQKTKRHRSMPGVSKSKASE